MAKTKVKAIKKLDNKSALLLAAAAAILGFLVYVSYAGNFGDGSGDPKPVLSYKYNSKGIRHNHGEAVEDPDWRQLVWRSSDSKTIVDPTGEKPDEVIANSGFAWRGPNVEQAKGKYKVCFYTEKEAGGEDNSIYYDVIAGNNAKVIAAYEGPTSFDWSKKRYWRDCLSYQLTKRTGKIQFRAAPKKGTFDIAKVEVFKGSVTPPNSDILNETHVEGQ